MKNELKELDSFLKEKEIEVLVPSAAGLIAAFVVTESATNFLVGCYWAGTSILTFCALVAAFR